MSQECIRVDNYRWDSQKNETLRIEKIVRACFLNPDRKKILPPYHTYEAAPKLRSAEDLIELINLHLKPAAEKFDSARLGSLDISWLKEKNTAQDPVDKSAFLNYLKTSKWYGPSFIDKTNTGNLIIFRLSESTKDGFSAGLVIDFGRKTIFYIYNKSMKNCG